MPNTPEHRPDAEALLRREKNSALGTRVLVDISEPKRKEDLRNALARGLQDWNDAPAWLIALYYEIIRDQAHVATREEVAPDFGRAEIKINKPGIWGQSFKKL